MRASRRSVAGLPAQQARVVELREDLEWARQVCIIAALLPYAAPRLPQDVLGCFNAQQKKISPLPKDLAYQASLYKRRQKHRAESLVPLPRQPMSSESLERNNRGGRS